MASGDFDPYVVLEEVRKQGGDFVGEIRSRANLRDPVFDSANTLYYLETCVWHHVTLASAATYHAGRLLAEIARVEEHLAIHSGSVTDARFGSLTGLGKHDIILHMMNTISTNALYLRVKEALWHEITRGELATADMLPPEQVLCKRLGVSRSTLRRAVTALEQEGALRRRQGIGTCIDRNVVDLGARMDLKLEFSEFLTQAGYSPEVKLLGYKEEPADQRCAKLLRLEAGSPVVNVTKLWLADGKPAILCTAIMPSSLFLRPYDQEALRQDVFTVLEELGSQKVDYQIATVTAQCLDKELASILGADPGTPIISIEAVGHTVNGVPILYSTERHAPGIVPFQMRRARI